MITYKELVKKHKILQVKRVDVFNTKKSFYPFEGFGIECGEGWYDLLDQLCTDIEKELIKANDDKEEYPFQINQIKEKLGGLRFYISSGNDKIYDMISAAEKKSYTICEECGKEGKLYEIRGWLSTLCKESAIPRLKEWKDLTIESIDRTQKEIIKLKNKTNKTKEETIEFNEAMEWFDIGTETLVKINKDLKDI